MYWGHPENHFTDLNGKRIDRITVAARQGEVLGLQWHDVDFIKKQIHIRRTFNHEKWFEPKTKGSIRKIDLSPMVVKALA